MRYFVKPRTANQVCQEYLGGCCNFGDRLSRRCVARCSAGSCAEGFVCGSNGLCGAVLCTNGYACAAHFSCTPSNTEADLHGCARASCVSDADCSRGYCVESRCYAELGICGRSIAVP